MSATPHQLSFDAFTAPVSPPARPSPTAPTRRIPVRAHERTVRPTNPTATPQAAPTRSDVEARIGQRPPKRYARANAPVTTHQAADKSADAFLSGQRLHVYRAIANHRYHGYAHGLTLTEIEEVTGIKGDSCRPRRKELEERGFVVNSGEKRPAHPGSPHMAVVWRVARADELPTLPYQGEMEGGA